MRINKKIILGVTTLYFLSNPAISAPKISVEKNKQAAIDNLNNLSEGYIFQVDTKSSINGKVRYKLAQYYHGVRVWDSAITTRTDNLKLAKVSDLIGGDYIIEIEKDVSSVTPTITAEQAILIAMQKQPTLAKIDPSIANVDLLIDRNDSGYAQLVYLVNYFDDTLYPRRLFTKVDAHTGRVVDSWDGLTSRNATGPGGNEKTGKYYYGLDNPLLVAEDCTMMNPNVSAWDMRNTNKTETLFKFTCPENTYKETNGAFSPINDAFYFANKVNDMYQEWFDKPPLEIKQPNQPPKKIPIKIRIHYSKNFDNANWDGKQITFGDGTRKIFPFVSLDVVSHEIAHGFTEFNSRLVYKGQSGAIDESFSDMAGEAIKYYMNKDKPEDQRNNWIFGENVPKTPGRVLRHINDPTLEGGIDHIRDWYEGISKHIALGLFDRAFYLLATTPGWNTKKAFEVFLWTNELGWSQNTTFDEAACRVSSVTVEAGYEQNAVIAAFEAVGIDASCKQGVEAPPVPDEIKNKVKSKSVKA